jgi:hypothetical protein
LNAIFTKSAHESMGDGDLPQSVDRCGFIDGALSDQQSEPPALAAEFVELGVGDFAPGHEQWIAAHARRATGGHATALCDFAHAMLRDRIQRSVASVGARGGRSL